MNSDERTAEYAAAFSRFQQEAKERHDREFEERLESDARVAIRAAVKALRGESCHTDSVTVATLAAGILAHYMGSR